MVWKESLGRRDLLKLVTKEDFAEVAHRKHIEHVGNNFSITTYIAFAQDDDGFSRSTEDDEKTFCWMCSVKVRMLENSLCSGCLRARYCSQECLVADWGVHGEGCEERREDGQEEGDDVGESQEGY